MFQFVRPSQAGRRPGHGDSLLVAVVVGVAAQRARNKYVHPAGKGLEIELGLFPHLIKDYGKPGATGPNDVLSCSVRL